MPTRGCSKVVKLASLVIHCSTDQHLASKVVFPFLEIAGQTTLSFIYFKEKHEVDYETDLDLQVTFDSSLGLTGLRRSNSAN